MPPTAAPPTVAPTAAATTAPAATAMPAVAPTFAPISQASGNLVMLDWSGYDTPAYWSQFAQEYPSVKVQYSFLGESADAYAKLQSGFNADLVHPCANYWKLLVDQKLVQPLDTSKLTNWKDVNPSLAKQGQFNGQQYWAPYDWGFESILVRKDKVQKEPTSWADLWDPQYKGHIAVFDSGETMHVITALALGFDPWKTTPDQDAQIKAKLLQLMPNVLTIWSDGTALDQMVASGDVWVAASAWNASYINAVKAGLSVDYLNPKEGRAGYVCGFAIPTTSKNVNLALAMIDAYLNPYSSAQFASDQGYGISNNAGVALMDPKTVALMQMNDANIIGHTVFYQSLTDAQRQSWTNTWSEVKTSK
jgi:spermidine/putrescine transport system substrate-binding protein